MAHPNTVRAPLEETHNALRAAREKQFVDDKKALEDDFHADLAKLREDKEQAMVGAGLNPDGSFTKEFAMSLAETAPPANPVNNTAPKVTGTAKTGKELTCSPGKWTQADSFTYQWQRDGVNIGGATANTRTLVMADETHVLRCVVTATNEHGTTTANSNTVTPTA